VTEDDGFESPPFLIDVQNIDLRDYLPSVASAHLGIWHRAVVMQAERVLDAAVPPVTRQTDAYLFVQALREVLRAAELMKRALADDTRAEAVLRAMAEFDAAVPRAKDARDVLDHFDDYARGIGLLSHPGVRDPKRREMMSSAEAASQFTIFYERGDEDHYILHIGDIAIDIAQARDAANRLADEVLGAWWEPAEDEQLAALLADHEPDGPYFVAWAFFAVVSGELPAEKLESVVTPESLSLWHVDELLSLTYGYSIASRVIYASDEIAYVKLVHGPEFPSIVSAPTLVDALIVTLQRRPDLGSQWRVHALGAPIEPKDMPKTTLPVAVPHLAVLFGVLKRSIARLFP
jgi:hypothetical protein